MLMKKKKNNKKFSFGKIFTLIFSLVIVGLSITLADLFSSLITVGGFSFTNEDITFNKYTVYAVCTSSHPTDLTAKENATLCQNQGGAGYIYLKDNSYYIIASIYENEEDAKKVKDNLKSTKPNIEILKIDIPSISINNNLETSEKDILVKSVNVFKDTFKKLYDISVSLDTSVISEVNAKLSINSIGGEISKLQNNFNTMFISNMSSNLVTIKLKLEELCTSIKNLIDGNVATPISSSVKYCYSDIIFKYLELAEQLQ